MSHASVPASVTEMVAVPLVSRGTPVSDSGSTTGTPCGVFSESVNKNEGREQEEDHIDQRNDLDARFLSAVASSAA